MKGCNVTISFCDGINFTKSRPCIQALNWAQETVTTIFVREHLPYPQNSHLECSYGTMRLHEISRLPEKRICFSVSEGGQSFGMQTNLENGQNFQPKRSVNKCHETVLLCSFHQFVIELRPSTLLLKVRTNEIVRKQELL